MSAESFTRGGRRRAFNLEDDRNNLTIMLADADAMAAELERELDGDY